MNKRLSAPALTVIAAALAVVMLLATGCSDDNDDGAGCGAEYLTDAELIALGEFTDARDCKVYGAAKIGDLIWMTENLNYKTRDGFGSWCYDANGYRDDNCQVLGRFYDWTTAMDIDDKYLTRSWNGSDMNHQGVCPDGWRLPNHRDWDNLIMATGDPQTAGTKLKATLEEKEQAQFRWHGNATDEFGFAALPGASRNSNGWYYHLKFYAYWWTSTQYDYTNAMYYHMSYQTSRVEDMYDKGKDNGLNIRCVRGGL